MGLGKLDAENQQNAWISVPPDQRLVFGADLGAKWREALASLKIDPLLSGSAGRA